VATLTSLLVPLTAGLVAGIWAMRAGPPRPGGVWNEVEHYARIRSTLKRMVSGQG
jgi:hypothetical protein